MNIQTLEDLFKDQLFDMYNAEKQITKALENMAEKASDQNVAEAFRAHLNETREQVTRLEQVCEMLDWKIEPEKCEGMEGILREANKLIENCETEAVCDATMIAAAQKVEHYEIASYGTLCALAKVLGHDDVEKLLWDTLEEERRADEKLTQVAEEGVNEQATQRAA